MSDCVHWSSHAGRVRCAESAALPPPASGQFDGGLDMHHTVGAATGPVGKAQRNPRGFTLIELLVVVAIIALLIAILLPSLNKAKEQTRLVVCLSRMRTIGQGVMIYAA